MATSIVIKVQYGETLRRFSSQVVDGKLNLDMKGLREKVCSLYSFPAGSELVLTYIDEDTDVVTLADEEDLNDIVRQSLNPLRITVKLIRKKSASSQSNSSGNSTPVREPEVQIPLHVKSNSATEVLNSLPDTVRETVLKLSTELGFDSNSPSGYADLLDSLAKMGLSYLKEASVSGAKGGPVKSFIDATVTKDGNSSLAVGTPQVSGKKSIDTKQDNRSGFLENFVMEATDMAIVKDKPSTLSAKATPDSFDVTGGSKQDFLENFAMEATDMEIVENKPSTLSPKTTFDSFNVTAGHKQDKVKDDDFRLHDKWGNCNIGFSEGNKVGNNAGSTQKMETKNSTESRQFWNYVMGPQPSNNARSGHKLEAIKSTDPRQGREFDPWTGIESSFSNFPCLNKHQNPHRVAPFKRSYTTSDGISSIFHRGVRCDGCGIHPISGPRFKSKVREDYDLCSICFADIGTEAEYIRMDHPISYKKPMSCCFQMQEYCLGQSLPTLPEYHSRMKLDSCFIKDVNILDGTIMTPSSHFTKIWRMRNNGRVVWPHGVHLVWIGGNMLSKALSRDIKIPADGCPVDKEIDVAVDFTAPVHPGRYVSYWRLSTPSGHKFGQRVWVIIQVSSSQDPLGKNAHGINLNWPPVGVGGIMHQGSLLNSGNYGNYSKPMMEKVTNIPKRDQGLNLPTEFTPLVAGAELNSGLCEASLPLKFPAANMSKVEPTSLSVQPNPDAGVPNSMVGVVQGTDVVEQSLLQDLEDMGFKQVDLNKKILRKNDYDLEQTLDDLCKWDPILKEMQ
ncbi:protein JOKA2 isoform X1 [Daucus carota subsp. sativus]|uniref:protein JOKA2 isoform X1 n=1 Tax=Daucus carota subsp. sativus TaxID=79200 RepID=UPI0007EFD260|nr:PREDICTED: protein NBR1 homolog isoform X1 [Daucus carota subsp. sativus]